MPNTTNTIPTLVAAGCHQSFRVPEGRHILQSSRASHAAIVMGDMDGMGDPLQGMDYESDGGGGDYDPPGFDEEEDAMGECSSLHQAGGGGGDSGDG